MRSATFQNLTIENVAQIAARHGFDWNDEHDRTRIIEPEARQADEYHGRPCKRLNDGRKHWGAGACGDFYHAANLLDGYLSQHAYEAACDDRAIAQFHRDAYGD